MLREINLRIKKLTTLSALMQCINGNTNIKPNGNYFTKKNLDFGFIAKLHLPSFQTIFHNCPGIIFPLRCVLFLTKA